MTDNAIWWTAALITAGVAYLVWAWRDAIRAERQREEFVERAAARHQAWRQRTTICDQCGGLGRVEREGGDVRHE